MHGRCRCVEERLRENPQHDQQHGKAQHHDHFPSVHAFQNFVGLCRAEVGAVDHDQRVDRTEHQTGGGNRRDPGRAGEAAQQNQELADEIAGAWQTQRGGCKEQADGRDVSNARPQAAHLAHVTGMQALVQLTAEDEQRGGDSP